MPDIMLYRVAPWRFEKILFHMSEGHDFCTAYYLTSFGK